MRLILLILVMGSSSSAGAQVFVEWSDLTEGISFRALSPEAPIPGFSKAEFSEDLALLEGEEIILSGYFLNLGGTPSVYMLSKNPMASCFFCGNGGPETVTGLKFREEPSFSTDDLLSVRGILRLNRDNPNEYYFRIEVSDAFSLE